MKPFHYIPTLIILLLVAACTSDDSILSPDTGEQGDVTFLFQAGSEITTRTQLPGSDNLQHAEAVWLYVFDTSGECVAVEDVGWKPADDITTNGEATKTQKYTVKYKGFEALTAYTFLAVGLDNESGATYGFPSAIKEKTATQQGTPLSEAKAVLATGKSRENIAISELFAGSEVLTTNASKGLAGRIELNRRVAGVMGWFKNAPLGTTEIRISLYTRQNKSGYLLKQEPGTNYPSGDIKNPNNFKDYITDPISTTDGDKILVSIAVPTGTEATTVLAKGSYVLPAAAPAVGDGTEYTLLIELVSSDGTISKTMRAKLKEGDDLYIDPTAGGTGIIDTGGPFRFPIVANNFYGIGSASAPVDLGGDEGDDIVIIVNPDWEKIEPTIPLE